jgi:signal transduction histidine kinase
MVEADLIRRDIEAVARISSVPTILRVISETTGLRLTLVARVTQTQWTACAVNDQLSCGLEPGGSVDVATTLCSKVRDTRATVIVEHASQDPLYCNHPGMKMCGFESYIAVPIFLADGRYFGNVCALDRKPAQLRQPRIESMMKLFAELIAAQLAAEAHQEATRAQLLDAQKAAELREQFIAVLGHDLRNPLSSVTTGAALLLRGTLNDKQRSVVERIMASGRRMSELISNLLDLARARTGRGLGLTLAETSDLGGSLRHVVDELASVHNGRQIRFTMEMSAKVRCDSARVCQLLSNLLANAIEHGAPSRPIDVHAAQTAAGLTISVRNDGPPIPEEMLPLLFRPYSRGSGAASKGLGLGLYIASEIAKAHGGKLEVESSAKRGTRFTVTLPAVA